MSRIYNIRLRCGCLIAEPTEDNPGGGGLISCEVPEICVAGLYFIHESYQPLVRLVEHILNDATGSINDDKRVWSIRAKNYRIGRRLLRELREKYFEIMD